MFLKWRLIFDGPCEHLGKSNQKNIIILLIFLLKWSPCWLTSTKLHHWGHATVYWLIDWSMWSVLIEYSIDFFLPILFQADWNSQDMTTSPSSITSRSEDKKGWEFADFAECLSWHDKNSTFPGTIFIHTYIYAACSQWSKIKCQSIYRT